MQSPDIIESILKRGAEHGFHTLSRAERKIWLISEAEVLCDMEGIDSFVNQYAALLTEAAEAFAGAGAVQIAESLLAIHNHLPSCPDGMLNRAQDLITSRTGYDYESVVRLLSHSLTEPSC